MQSSKGGSDSFFLYLPVFEPAMPFISLSVAAAYLLPHVFCLFDVKSSITYVVYITYMYISYVDVVYITHIYILYVCVHV